MQARTGIPGQYGEAVFTHVGVNDWLGKCAGGGYYIVVSAQAVPGTSAGAAAQLSSTYPFTWVAPDTLDISFNFEAVPG